MTLLSDPFELTRHGPVIPVIVVESLAQARPLAQALVDGGLRVLEVTLRSEAALAAIGRMREVPGAIVGAGTVCSAEQVDQVADAGAQFVVSPGWHGPIGEACARRGLPWLPGVATAGEVLRARADGHRLLKFFPAVPAGGVPMLKALAGPFPDVQFCPTGGLTAANFGEFLALPNVAVCGGSWLMPPAAVADGDWLEVERLARAAAAWRKPAA